MTLFTKDRNIKESFIYGGYIILKILKKKKNRKASFYEISEELTNNHISNYRQQCFCLMFLYACDLIVFNEPYIEIKNAN